MDEAIQFTSQQLKLSGGQGTGAQMLGLVDNLSQTFDEKLAAAKSDLSKEEKVSAKKKDAEKNEAEAKPEEQAEQKTDAQKTNETAEKKSAEEASAKSELQVKIEDPAPEGALLEEADGLAVEVAEQPLVEQEPVLAEPEAEAADAPVAEESEAEITLPEGLDMIAAPESGEAAATEELVDEEPVAEADTAEIADIDGVAEEAVAATEATSQPLVEQEPIAEEELVEQEPAAKAKPLGNRLAGARMVPSRAVPVQEQLVEQEPVADIDGVAEVADIEGAKEVADIDGIHQVADIEGFEAEAEVAEEAPDDFHSILSKDETDKQSGKGVLFELDADESARIMQNLSEMASRTQVQAPIAQKVSTEMLEGLKAQNAPLARQIESIKGQSVQPGGIGQAGGSKVPMPFKEARPMDKPYANPQLEQLKQKVVDQVKFQMRMAMRGKVGEVKVILKPHVLGNVRVQLLVEDAQRITANFLVENQSVRELLTRSSTQLQQVLNEQGYDVNDIDVSVADQNLEDGGGGKGFASVEDQKAAREYLASLAALGLGARDGNELPEEPSQADSEPSDPNQVLNIVA